MRFATAIAAAACLTIAACAAPPGTTSTCTLEKVGDFPVTTVDGNLTIVIQIDHQPERMILDTGSGSTLILPAAYNNLPTTQIAPLFGDYGTGVGGTMQINTAINEDLQIGKVNLKDEILYIADFGFESKPGQAVIDGLLGYDVLGLFDVAIDMPDHVITLYFPQKCSPPETPWPGNYDVETFIPRPDRINEPDIGTEIDGKTIVMAIDSGANFSMVMHDAITADGLTPEATSSTTASGLGIGHRAFGYRHEQFSSVTLGAETFSDMWLKVSNRSSDPDSPAQGLLGDDYLAHHRVFLMNTARTAYLGLTVAPQN